MQSALSESMRVARKPHFAANQQNTLNNNDYHSLCAL
jgi:hypothetical protein